MQNGEPSLSIEKHLRGQMVCHGIDRKSSTTETDRSQIKSKNIGLV